MAEFSLRILGEAASFLLERGFGIEDAGDCVLSAAEVCYVSEKKLAAVGAKEVKVAAKKCEKDVYLVYRLLRERGFVPIFSQKSRLLRVHERGVRRGEDRPRYVVEVVKEAEEFSAKGLYEKARLASKMRKDYFLAIVHGKNVEFITVAKRSFE